MSVDKIKSNMSVFTSTVQDKIRHHHLQFSNEDELINHYRDDLSGAISGLKFLVAQMHRLSKYHWARLLALNVKIAQTFMDLIGEHSLQFKDIDKYYHEFDEWQAEETIPTVHPKERQFLIESVNHQLSNYMVTMKQLQGRVVGEWDFYAELVKIRVGEMVGYLKQLIQLIKKRNKKRSKYDKFHGKVDKLMKKTVELDDKERKQLDKLDKELLEAGRQFSRANDRVKAVLPHALALLDEFVENVTKATLCKQLDLYRDIDDCLQYFGSFQGLMDRKEAAPHIPQLETVCDLWDQAATPTRLQIESFISIIHNKRPELLDTEIDSEDKKLKIASTWTKVTDKAVEKNHIVKAKDAKNGVFIDYLEADPLRAFEEYNNPKYNMSDTYHPHKIIKNKELEPEKPTHEASKPAPALPPRSNTAGGLTKKAQNGPPLPRRGTQLWYVPPEADEADDSDSSSLSSADSVSSSGASSLSEVIRDEEYNKNVVKLYNSAKNDITEAPVTAELADTGHHRVPQNVTERLFLLTAMFAKLAADSEPAVRTAKYDYHGTEPGDLSFREGDAVTIAFDFSPSNNPGWLVGSVQGKSGQRMGFVPSNYF